MSFHEMLNVILFHKTEIIRLTLISALFLFLILMFVYPRTYNSAVSILPPEKNNSLSGVGALISGGDVTSLLTPGSSNANSQLYVQILKSRSALEYVVRKLNLVKYYGSDDVGEAVEKLSRRLTIDLTKEGIINLSVDANTSIFPVFMKDDSQTKLIAAELSNTFVEALDHINREKLSSKAGSARKYIEEQLRITKTKMDSAELALMSFQKNNKTISLPDQMKAVIEGAAQVKAEMLETEVQIGLMETNLREDNRSLQGLKDKLANLQKQYDKMEIGDQDFLLAFRDVPELGRELAALLRDVKIQNEVYMILQQQYYKERIQENKDIPTVEVLDKAIPPRKASGPRVFYSSLLGGLFIFLLISVFYVFSEKFNIKRYQGPK